MFLKLYNIINHASLGLSSLNKPEANGLLLSCIFTVDRTVRRREAWLTLYSLTSTCKLSILCPIHILQC